MTESSLSSPHDPEIREATPDDAEGVLRYVHQISHESEFLSFGPGEFELTEEEERDFLATSLKQTNKAYFIAVQQREIVGAICFSGGDRPRMQHTGELGLSVAKAHWNKGLGTRLLAHLIAWSNKNPIVNKLQLRVRTDNTRAFKLYKRLGFRIEGTIKREICVNGVYYDGHLMALDTFGSFRAIPE